MKDVVALLDEVPLLVKEDGKYKFFLTFKTDDGEEVKYHEVKIDDYPRFNNVLIGQAFARVGDDATDIKAGEAVVFEEGERVFSALANGRVIFDGEAFRIENKIVIEGNLTHRDIDFVGSLEVKGDVKGDLKIRAMGGVKIHGDLHCAVVETGGDVELNRIYGHNRALIQCRGDFFAQCVYDAQVECRKNAIIQMESVNSVIRAKGKVLIIGTVTGGECVSLLEIEARRAGSPQDINTLLKAGEDFGFSRHVENIKGKIDKVCSEIDQLKLMLGSYEKRLDEVVKMPQNKKDRIFALLREKRSLETTRAEWQVELNKTDSFQIPGDIKPKIFIAETLHKGVTVQIGETSEFIAADRLGPIQILAGETPETLNFKKN